MPTFVNHSIKEGREEKKRSPCNSYQNTLLLIPVVVLMF